MGFRRRRSNPSLSLDVAESVCDFRADSEPERDKTLKPGSDPVDEQASEIHSPERAFILQAGKSLLCMLQTAYYS